MFEDELRKWDRYFCSTRQVGHTYAVLNGVLNTKEALVVATHKQHQQQFPKGKAIMFGDSLNGRKNPIVFDNFTVHHLIQESLYRRIDRQKVEEAIIEFEAMKKPNIDSEIFSEECRIKIFKKKLGLEK